MRWTLWPLLGLPPHHSSIPEATLLLLAPKPAGCSPAGRLESPFNGAVSPPRPGLPQSLYPRTPHPPTP